MARVVRELAAELKAQEDATLPDAGATAPGVDPTPARALFDVIIEDGSHLYRDQLLNMAQLLPLVAPGGTYVIEDIHTSLQHGYDDVPGTRNRETPLNVMGRLNASLRTAGPVRSTTLSKFWTARQQSEVVAMVERVEVRRGHTRGDLTCLVTRSAARPRPAGPH